MILGYLRVLHSWLHDSFFSSLNLDIKIDVSELLSTFFSWRRSFYLADDLNIHTFVDYTVQLSLHIQLYICIDWERLWFIFSERDKNSTNMAFDTSNSYRFHLERLYLYCSVSLYFKNMFICFVKISLFYNCFSTGFHVNVHGSV